MLLPRYSLRHLLAGVVIGSLLFVVAAQAARGAAWATGVTIAVAAALFSLGVYALTFLGVWIVAVPYQARRMRRKGVSPFEELPEPLFAGEPVPAQRVAAAGSKPAAAGVRGTPGDALDGVGQDCGSSVPEGGAGGPPAPEKPT